MAEGRWDRSGGILGLCSFIDEHAEAVESDLLEHGYRLSDLLVTYSWRDLLVMVRHWQDEPGTALSASVHGHRLWADSDHLLATILDAIQLGNWQRAGKKHARKPKLTPRPGDKKPGQSFGSDPIPISKFRAWWDSATKKKQKRG